MKKRTVLSSLYAAAHELERATLAAARSEEVSPRQRERVAFALRLTSDVIDDFKTKDK